MQLYCIKETSLRQIIFAKHCFKLCWCASAAFALQEGLYRDTYAMLCIHMWMTLVRLRSEGKPGKDLTQLVYDNFQDNVEHRVRAAGVMVSLSHMMNRTFLPLFSHFVAHWGTIGSYLIALYGDQIAILKSIL